MSRDRLDEIKEDLDFGPGWRGLTPEYAIEHVRWMVGEITALRAMLEMTERALQNGDAGDDRAGAPERHGRAGAN